MNRNLFFVLFFAASIHLNAQQALEKKIPKQATFVLSFNLKSLSAKVNFNDLGNYNFLKKPDIDNYLQPNIILKELFRLPDKAAISRTGKLFIFPENHDSIHNLNYLISISDAKVFETRMVDILKTKQNEAKFKKDGKLRVLNYQNEMCITIAKDYAIISTWQQPYYSAPYDYDEYSAEKNEIVRQLDSIKYANELMDTSSVEIIEEPTEPVINFSDTALTEDSDPDVEADSAVIDDGIAEQVEAVADEPYYDPYYDNDSMMKQFERRWVIKRKLMETRFYENHQRKMNQRQKYINDQKPGEGIAVNAEFTKVFTHTDDIIYWFQYESYSQQLIDLMSDKYFSTYYYDSVTLKEKLKNKPPNTLIELMQNNVMYGLGNFNKGEIKMNFYNTFNDKIKPYIEKIYSKNINPEFFNYIKSDNLIGLIGCSMNTEAGANLYYEIFRRAYESAAIPRKELVAILELSDLFLDKNVLHHTFKGDAVLAITGIKSYLRSYSNYVYDSLTFESKAVEVTNTQYRPEFTAILTIENLTNVKRILKMITRLDGLSMISENAYKFNSKYLDSNNHFYIVIKNNLLFITNDKPLATEQIAGGLSLQRTVGNKYKDYLNYSCFGFWDASKMFKLMAKGPEEKFGKPDELEKWSEKINNGFFVSKAFENNTANTEITLEMKNRENSSLLELLKLFDDVYVMKNFKF